MIRNIYLSNRLYFSGIGIIVISLLSYQFEVLVFISRLAILAWAALIFLDAFLLFKAQKPIGLERLTADRYSNGDDHPVQIKVGSAYGFNIHGYIIDQPPMQFQKRNFRFVFHLKPGSIVNFSYTLNPKQRGIYSFGNPWVFVQSPLRMLARRFIFQLSKDVKVYPAFHQLDQIIRDAQLQSKYFMGQRKLRVQGNYREFEQIRNYVAGDEYRNINWKATARRNLLMTNQYQQDSSQGIYACIDMGRTMKTAFDHMTLMDYAINATLALGKLVIEKYDRMGLMSFNTQIHTFLTAESNRSQMTMLNEALYNLKSQHLESDYDLMASHVIQQLNQRSLLVLFTYFDSIQSIETKLPALKLLATKHRLLLIIFKNSLFAHKLAERSTNKKDIYLTYAIERLNNEVLSKLKTLRRSGIMSMYVHPAELRTSLINKYLEIKNLALI